MSGSQTGPSGPNGPVESNGTNQKATASAGKTEIYVPGEHRGASLEDVLEKNGRVETLRPGEKPTDPGVRWEEPGLEETHE